MRGVGHVDRDICEALDLGCALDRRGQVGARDRGALGGQLGGGGRAEARGCSGDDCCGVLDLHQLLSLMIPLLSPASARLITIRWIWFVPSKICMTFASRMKRSTGKSDRKSTRLNSSH